MNASSTPKPANATVVTFRCNGSENTQPATMRTNATAVIHSSRVMEPNVVSALRAAAGASGVLPTPGGNRREISSGNATIAIKRRDGRGDEPAAEIDLNAEVLRDLNSNRISRCRRHPQRRRDGEAGHRAEHEIPAEPATLGVLGTGTGSLGDREHDRKQNAAARRVARKCGRDRRVGQHDTVRETERRTAEKTNHEQADALAQAGLDDGLRYEKRDHHQQHARVRKPGERLGRCRVSRSARRRRPPASWTSTAGRRRREPRRSRRRRSRRGATQAPSVRREPVRARSSPRAQTAARGAVVSRDYSPTRTRPVKPSDWPCTVPSSVAIWKRHEN